MEPTPARASVVPKLHLLFSTSSNNNASSARVEEQQQQHMTDSTTSTQLHRSGCSTERSPSTHHSNTSTSSSNAHTARYPLLKPKPALSASSPHQSSPRFAHPTPPRTSTSHSADRAAVVVVPLRVSTATVEYLESPKLPPMLQRQLRETSAGSANSPSSVSMRHSHHYHDYQRSATADTLHNNTSSSSNYGDSDDAFQILHPSLDLTDDSGELAKLMLSKWSVDAGEHAFASISLFCEMKLNEAKRMASWLEAPNRFFVTVCCQLLSKYIDRVASTTAVTASSSSSSCRSPGAVHPNGNDRSGSTGCGSPAHGSSSCLGHSATFLRRILSELVTAIFLPLAPTATATAGGGPSVSDATNYDQRVPYFTVRPALTRDALLHSPAHTCCALCRRSSSA